MTEPRLVPGAASSTRTIAALTLRRLLRGRALWVSLIIASLPVAYALVMTSTSTLGVGEELFAFELLVIAVLAPMFVGASIGEEIEDRTTTYLWSRPVPRWSVLAGKLLALAPITMIIVIASWIIATRIAWEGAPLVRSSAALAIGALTVSLVATGIATIGPRHGMALTIVYMLFFDFPISVLPATLQQGSVAYQVRALSGLWPADQAIGSAVLGLALLSAAWVTVAALRIRRLEA